MKLENIYFDMCGNDNVQVCSQEEGCLYTLYCTWHWHYGQEYENGIGCFLSVDCGICLEQYPDGTEEEYGYGIEDEFLEQLSEKFTDYIYENHYELIEEKLQSDYYYYRYLINE